jgi:hypothetical protein
VKISLQACNPHNSVICNDVHIAFFNKRSTFFSVGLINGAMHASWSPSVVLVIRMEIETKLLGISQEIKDVIAV